MTTPKQMNQILKIALGFLIVASVAGLYFANGKLTSVASETSKLKADTVIAQKQLATYQKTKTQVDSLSYVNELANKVLPTDTNQSAIVAEISEFALRSNLTLSKITFTDAKTAVTPSATKSTLAVPKGVVIIPLTIQIKAGAKYTNLLAFLKTVEGNQRKSQVTNISLVPDSKDRSVLSQVTIQMNLYAQQPVAGSKK